MTEWIVRRWTRYGHDRLYAATPGGADLGYLDLKTDRFHTDDLSNHALLRKAIEDYREGRRSAQPVAGGDRVVAGGAPGHPSTRETAAVEQSPPVRPLVSTTGWYDLAETRAGAAARERALAEREAQGTLRHVLARMLGARTGERAWRIGADGEEAVARELATLGYQWRILHAVRVGERGADIDHLVIGPGGVFTINTKHHPRVTVWVGGDTVLLNGRRVPYVRNSRHEARRASRLLAEHVGFPVVATGMIAMVGVRGGLTVKAQPADGAVVVVPRRKMARFLQTQPTRLGLREIDAIHEVARRSTTWAA